MKYLVAIFTVVALASCGAKKDTIIVNTGSTSTGTQTETTSTSTTNSSLTEEIKVMTGEISSGSTDEAKVEKLSTTFKTPGGEVSMNVSYSLDADKKFTTLKIDSNYSHQDFNAKAEKELLGKSVEEAKKLYISGASLASDAFKDLFKNA